ncbi:MAG: YbjQ family protein [Fimbriimonadales bacterium]
MLITTLPEVPGYRIVKVLGVVKGNTVRATHLGKDFLAGLRQLVGGELKEYTEMLSNARAESERRMLEEAARLGANAIVNVRFVSGNITANAAEILVYGTAVVVEPIEGVG